jgi:hypothetical protein
MRRGGPPCVGYATIARGVLSLATATCATTHLPSGEMLSSSIIASFVTFSATVAPALVRYKDLLITHDKLR